MNPEEIKQKAEELGTWYHEIELFPGYSTTTHMTAAKPVWENIRKARLALDYHGKAVLDIGTMTGLWAFEAEEIGGFPVVTVDLYQRVTGQTLYEQCLLARVARSSKVIFVPNGDVHQLPTFVQSLRVNLQLAEGFDIIQGLGLLYHTEHPFLALQQMRSCCRLGGKLLLETAVFTGGGGEPVLRFNSDEGIYCDPTTFWAPNRSCLLALLKASGWQPDLGTESVLPCPERPLVNRTALVCDAVQLPTIPTL